MLPFFKAVRAAMPQPRRLGIRVPPTLSVIDALGLDLSQLSRAGLIDWVVAGVHYFSFMAQASNFSDRQ